MMGRRRSSRCCRTMADVAAAATVGLIDIAISAAASKTIPWTA